MVLWIYLVLVIFILYVTFVLDNTGSWLRCYSVRIWLYARWLGMAMLACAYVILRYVNVSFWSDSFLCAIGVWWAYADGNLRMAIEQHQELNAIGAKVLDFTYRLWHQQDTRLIFPDLLRMCGDYNSKYGDSSLYSCCRTVMHTSKDLEGAQKRGLVPRNPDSKYKDWVDVHTAVISLHKETERLHGDNSIIPFPFQLS